MNGDTIKTELQQVLDNDIALRKEFNALKRSLSDYRNQLIMRDEDCKRLQVTIDVLNTKLAVLDRDNNTYKGELAAFKELRGTISEQLQAKQEEIDARLSEIQSLRDELTAVTAGYEAQIADIRANAAEHLEKVTFDYSSQIAELRSNLHYRETGLRDEYENRIASLTGSWAEKEQSLILCHEEELSRLKDSFEAEISSLTEKNNSILAGLSSASHEEVATLRVQHQGELDRLQDEYNTRYTALEASYSGQVTSLQTALDAQRDTLTRSFDDNIAALSAGFDLREAELRAGYEQKLEELHAQLSASSEELSASYERQLSDMKTAHDNLLNETTLSYEQKITELINAYEEKLSNTLIHSNAQNSKLDEELGRVRLENEQAGDRITALTVTLDTKIQEMEEISGRISGLETQLRNEEARYAVISEEFEAFRQNALLSNDEKITELNSQIFQLNQSHSEYVNELTEQILQLTAELGNLTSVFKSTTNKLGLAESALENAAGELLAAGQEIETLTEAGRRREEDATSQINVLTESYEKMIQLKDLEYQKLLFENTQIICEIETTYTNLEARDAELSLLKAELDEVKETFTGKVADLKETLNAKNFEITNLEGSNAALNQEVMMLKREILSLQEQVQGTEDTGFQVAALQHEIESSEAEKQDLRSEIAEFHATVARLNAQIREQAERTASLEAELETLKSDPKAAEQEQFIERLYREIETLGEQRLTLLEEKEQMAGQLLKMNEVIGNISQQVESERIDVTSLNNHRKNVILANNSEGAADNALMKEQINDLVREIDKCIALLSA